MHNTGHVELERTAVAIDLNHFTGNCREHVEAAFTRESLTCERILLQLLTADHGTTQKVSAAQKVRQLS
jgi:hypothetical protein